MYTNHDPTQPIYLFIYLTFIILNSKRKKKILNPKTKGENGSLAIKFQLYS